jgi:hypothetical protein
LDLFCIIGIASNSYTYIQLSYDYGSSTVDGKLDSRRAVVYKTEKGTKATPIMGFRGFLFYTFIVVLIFI